MNTQNDAFHRLAIECYENVRFGHDMFSNDGHALILLYLHVLMDFTTEQRKKTKDI